MRIALLTHDLPGVSTSGVGSYTLHCAAALARIGGGGGHEVHVFAFGEAKVPEGVIVHSVAGVAERVADGRIEGGCGAVLGDGGLAAQLSAQSELLCEAVRAAHAETPFDVVETPEVCFAGLPLMLRPIPGTPVVAMLHAGTAISRYFNDIEPSEEDRLLMALEYATICLADGLCAPTSAVVETTRRFLPFSQEVAVFPSPVPNAEFVGRQKTEGIGGYVMFAGRLEKLKGCCELALAANEFLRACPEAELRLYGPDRTLHGQTHPHRAPIDPHHGLDDSGHLTRGSVREWMIENLDPAVRARVRFMGVTPPEEMGAAYAGCRFVVAPSLFENFGTTAAEALVAGKPVVYAAGTGLAETVGDAGLAARVEESADLAKQMIRLWQDAELRRELTERGAARLRNELSVENAVARRVAFYREVIERCKAKRGNGVERLAALPVESVQAILRMTSGFAGRLAGIESGEAKSPGRRAARALEKLVKRIDSLWIYGGGQHTRRLLVERELIERAGVKICGIIDDAAKAGDRLFDLPVITRTAAEKREGTVVVEAVLISSDTIEEKLWANCEEFRRRDIPVVRLYS